MCCGVLPLVLCVLQGAAAGGALCAAGALSVCCGLLPLPRVLCVLRGVCCRVPHTGGGGLVMFGLESDYTTLVV